MGEHEDQYGHSHDTMHTLGSDVSRFGGIGQKLSIDASGNVKDSLGNFRGNVHDKARQSAGSDWTGGSGSLNFGGPMSMKTFLIISGVLIGAFVIFMTWVFTRPHG